MLSFWEQQHFLKHDFIVIGSGIVGLSTAIALKEKKPNKKVLVLERSILPTGASTKNAGFACIGSLTELLEDLETMSKNAVLQLVEQRWQGLQKLRERLGDKNIDYQDLGSYELLDENEINCLEQLDEMNEFLRPLFGNSQKAFHLDNKKIEQFGFSKKHIKAVVVNQYEGQLDTGKMMYNLLQYAYQLGIMVVSGAEVTHFDENKDNIRLQVQHHFLNETIFFEAKQVAICTNAFTKKLLPNLKIKAGRGQVIATKPIKNLPFKGIFHVEKGYYYFRNYGNRVIFGGGRNLDFKAENTTEFAYNEMILNNLNHKLQHVFLPNTSYEIETKWTGIMAFGEDKAPILKNISPRITIGVKLGGMGVAIGSLLGEKIAHKILIKI
ncbi:MAG: NAD(P)/FAD-dependent oxidoreductase [Chitinophagales bacterium]